MDGPSASNGALSSAWTQDRSRTAAICAHQMIVRHDLIEAERIEQLPLLLIEPPHHRSPPSIAASARGNQRSTAAINRLLQQNRPKCDVAWDEKEVRFKPGSGRLCCGPGKARLWVHGPGRHFPEFQSKAGPS